MSRPSPKKSALAGSPIQPASPPPPAQPAPTAAAPATSAQPASEPPAAQREEAPEPRKAKKKEKPEKKQTLPKTAFYQDSEAAARMRAAYLHTLALEGYNSLSAFIAQAVEEKVRRLEQKYNDGEPWPEVQAGGVPTGRPPRSA